MKRQSYLSESAYLSQTENKADAPNPYASAWIKLWLLSIQSSFLLMCTLEAAGQAQELGLLPPTGVWL